MRVRNRMKIATKLVLLTAVSLAVAVTLAVVAIINIGDLRDSNSLAAKQAAARTSLADLDAQVNYTQMLLTALGTTPASYRSQIIPLLDKGVATSAQDIKVVKTSNLGVDLTTVDTAYDTWSASVDPMAKAYVAKGVKVDIKQATDQFSAASTLTASTDKLRAVVAKMTDKSVAGAKSSAKSATVAVIVTLLLGIIALLAMGLAIGRGIVRPLRRVVTALRSVAKRDYSVQLPVVGTDDMAELATALNEAVIDVRGVVGTVATSAQSLETAADQLGDVSEQVGASSERTSTEAASASAAYTELHNHVSSVAAGAQEMTASIQEIARNSTEAASVAAEAVAPAQETTMPSAGSASRPRRSATSCAPSPGSPSRPTCWR